MPYTLLNFRNLQASVTMHAITGQADPNAQPLKNAEEKIQQFLGLTDKKAQGHPGNPVLPADIEPEMKALEAYVKAVEEIAEPFDRLRKMADDDPAAVRRIMFPD